MSLQLPAQTKWMIGMTSVLLVLFALKLHLIFLHNVNWDEFLFLAKVHAALRNDLGSALQTAYVHAFTWLPRVSENEIEQVIAARGVMLLLQAGTCGLIFLVGRGLFKSSSAAFVAALAYLSFSYVVDHGTSFRADPIAVFLLMFALWLIVRDRGGQWVLVLAGMLAALAGMVTVKSAFYLPTLLLATLFLRQDKPMRARFAEALAFGLAAALAFMFLYFLHRYAIDITRTYSAVSMVTRSADKVILLDQFFPRKAYLVYTFNRDTLAWWLVLGGVVLATVTAMKSGSRMRGTGLLGLSLPLLTLVFYRNAFPYYYVFILAGPAILGAATIAWLQGRLSGDNSKYFRIVFGMVIVVLIASGLERYLQSNVDRTVAQRQLIGTVHQMFPKPVPYVGHAPIVPSFPYVGFFMSTWGMENYIEAGKPIMRDLLLEQRPVFLTSSIFSRMAIPPGSGAAPTVVAEDVAVLRSNFLQHWGPIWVAGKKIELLKAGTSERFEILVPGVYTLGGDTSVTIDGVRRIPGDAIEFAVGFHTLRAERAPAAIMLRWGTDLYRPPYAPVRAPIFVPFNDLS